MRTFLRQLVAALRELPGFIDEQLHALAVRPHRPLSIGDGFESICPRCQTMWPCDELIRLEPRPAVRDSGDAPE